MALDYFDENKAKQNYPSPKPPTLKLSNINQLVHQGSLLSADTFRTKMRNQHTFSKIIPSYEKEWPTNCPPSHYYHTP